MARQTLSITLSTVPAWAFAKAAVKTRELNLPVQKTSVLMAALGAFIGLSDRELTEFATPKKRNQNLEEFLASLESDGS